MHLGGPNRGAALSLATEAALEIRGEGDALPK
jgi:hypothetical protein